MFIGASFVSVLGIARSYKLNLSFEERIVMAIKSFQEYGRFKERKEATILAATEELSGSFMCNQIAVRAVDRGEPFHYGKYQVSYILNMIPFLPSTLRDLLGIPETELSSSTVINNYYLGKHSKWALGSSCIADFYLELGLLGVLIGLFVVGMFYKYIDSFLIVDNSSFNIITTTLFIIYSSKAIYIPRSMFLGELKLFLMPIIILYLYNYFYLSKKNI